MSEPIEIELAREFHSIIRREFDARELYAVDQRNQKHVDHCATHDFCDSNMLMLEAFMNVVGSDIDFENEVDCRLIDASWRLAKDNGFSQSWIMNNRTLH
jgi:hypothetical protein